MHKAERLGSFTIPSGHIDSHDAMVFPITSLAFARANVALASYTVDGGRPRILDAHSWL